MTDVGDTTERAARIVNAIDTLTELMLRYERRLIFHRPEDRALAKRAARAAQSARDTAVALADRVDAAERERDDYFNWQIEEKLGRLAAEERAARYEEALQKP